MKKHASKFTTLALANAIRKPMPRPSKPFKVKQEKRNDWRKDW